MNVKEIEGLYGVTSRRCPRTYGIQYSSQKRTCVYCTSLTVLLRDIEG
jgi:hypothetical protein